MFNDKRITAKHDGGHKFKLKYESVGAPTPPAYSFSLSPETPVSAWTTSGRCVIAAVLEKLCSQAKGSPLSCPVMGLWAPLCGPSWWTFTNMHTPSNSHLAWILPDLAYRFIFMSMFVWYFLKKQWLLWDTFERKCLKDTTIYLSVSPNCSTTLSIIYFGYQGLTFSEN